MRGHTRRATGWMLWALVLSLVRHGLAQTGKCPAGTSAPIIWLVENTQSVVSLNQ
jgi:hypothetical protein